MATNNIFSDDGSIIGYRPQLEYSKKENEIEIKPSEKEEDVAILQQVEDYSYNSISNVYFHLNNALSKLNFSINELKEFYAPVGEVYNDIEAFEKYLQTKSPMADDYIRYHTTDIKGNSNLELFGLLYKEKQLLTELIEHTDLLFFGYKILSEEERRKIINQKKSKLETYEKETPYKINLPILVADTKLNYVLKKFGESITDVTLNHGSITELANQDSVDNETLSYLFDSIIKEDNYRNSFYSHEIENKTIARTLSGYYSARKDYFHTLNSLSGVATDSILYRHIANKEQQVGYVLSDICKATKGNQYYFKTILSRISEKNYIRELYRNNAM